MVYNRARVGKQTINRNQSRDAREQRQKRVERHPGSIGEDAVLRNTFVDAPQNILPPARRDLRWPFGEPTATRIELGVITPSPIGLSGVSIGLAASEPSCHQQGSQADRP